jgi:hypothetical protein
MKLKVFIASLLFALSATAVADSDKAAFTIWIDNACYWFMGEEGEIVSMADLHAILLNNGMWKVNCHGEVIAGTFPDKAMVLHSSTKKPTGLCCVETIGCTENVHVTVSPSGESTFICHGVVE